MKVLALVVLVLAVSGLEAGIIKRDVSADKITEALQGFIDNLKTNMQEFAAKVQSGELKLQAEQYLEQSKAHVEPIKAQLEPWTAQFEKWAASFVEAGKKLVQQ
ncbi:apolipoprotein A-II [Pelodytes ibericus]